MPIGGPNQTDWFYLCTWRIPNPVPLLKYMTKLVFVAIVIHLLVNIDSPYIVDYHPIYHWLTIFGFVGNP